MNDFAAALAPRSDQINASDLLAGDMTIIIAGVKVTPGTEQPVSISLQGHSKVWRPCKSTGRILMAAWGADTAKYVGRAVQLYLDPKVKWGGLEVGGIRIRAISHIDEDLRIVLAESKQVRKPVTVKRLGLKADAPPPPAPKYTAETAIARATEKARSGTDAFRVWYNSDDGKDCRETRALTPEVMLTLRDIASKADAAKDADPFGLPPIVDAPLDTRATTATDAELSDAAAREQAAVDLLERIDRGGA